ncbi:Tad domain-containing protein [Gemmata sp. JC673]|uniref:Tad domain-containing protein n=1 Tax=Gemmata algarum TaxID=2975278 RepID=A0ABU5F815_9BACT|nr:pilus assembly protein TadG-related protein [Gemmata algarum]MDY3562860.1 Tad domain-containing protein [Gemmata algarum]
MKVVSYESRRGRRGTILPLLGVCLIGLFAFVALAVDLGMLAVSRTQSQNGADVAALVGTRTLNNRDGVAYNNLPAAVTAAQASVTSNPHLSANFVSGQVSKMEVGQYLYDPTSQTFQVQNWTQVTGGGAMSAPGGNSWTAMRVTLGVSQPTYFMRVFGVNSMPSGAVATAVYRPRDIAFVLDMTGSMAFSSTFNSGNAQGSSNDNQSMNPDPLAPKAGHYTSVQSRIVATTNLANSSNEALPRNNFTITTPGGPPIVRSYYYDPSNWGTPSTVASPVTTKGDGSANLLPAFHRWSPPESGGDSDNYVAPTYDFTGYNPFHKGDETSPKGPTPAPDTYGTMTDASGLTYTGDRWRRRDGRIDKTTTDWSSSSNQAAYHAADLLGYGSAAPTANKGANTPFATNSGAWLDFRDPVWEMYGYDLDIVKYRTARGGSNNFPLNPATYLASTGLGVLSNILVPTADRFVGYSMGPGYWGKTFYIWPPDPRTPVGNPGDAGYVAGDWRRRYFYNISGGALDAQNDNNTTNTAGTSDPINSVVLNTGTSGQTINSAAVVNYAAVLKWIKSGPQVLPPNLRAGRVVYYTSIPDDVNTATGTAAQKLDKGFWKLYIDYVLGIGSYTGAGNLYGAADSWSASAASVTASDMTTYRFTWEVSASRPYMRYTDSPRRPRLHLWFGPLSMMDFLSSATSGNWTAGTVYEAQCWQLKAGVNAVLDDVKNNHPNDYSGLVYFAAQQHNGVRIPLGQNYKRIQNALFYPRNLVDAITNGDVTSEYRPYTSTSLGGYGQDVIPNASGTTDPATGLGYAFNLLSPSTITAAKAVGTGNGRRGAQKIVIFETDGVPNEYRVPTFNARGYNSYYTLGSVIGGNNGDTTNINYTYSVIQQIVKQMASTATTSGTGADSGLSLPNAPARVYPIAFGDLFDAVLAPNATFRPTANQFLANCAAYGGTGTTGATQLPDTQIITGSYDQRISRLRDCLERIFQSGVSVVLIE